MTNHDIKFFPSILKRFQIFDYSVHHKKFYFFQVIFFFFYYYYSVLHKKSSVFFKGFNFLIIFICLSTILLIMYGNSIQYWSRIKNRCEINKLSSPQSYQNGFNIFDAIINVLIKLPEEFDQKCRETIKFS